MDTKKIIQIENLESEKLLSEFHKVNEQLKTLITKMKFAGKEDNIKPYYSRKEVKEMLGVSFPTLHTWHKKGILKTCRLGSRIIYKAEDIEKAIIPMRD